MKELTAWVSGIVGVIALGILVDIMSGDGKMRRYVRSAFGIITVFAVVLPLPALARKDFSFGINVGDTSAGVGADGNYISAVYKSKADVIERGAEKYLADNGYGGVGVRLAVDRYYEDMQILFVYANLEKTVIDADKRHIDKYNAVKGLLSKFTGVDGDKVIPYGG